MTIPYTFAGSTGSIPLSYLDDNFAYVGDSSGIVYTPAGTGAVATTVQAKLRESVSVTDFGALTTSSDNTTAFNNAFTYAQSVGKAVFIPAGTWLVGALLFGSQSTGSGSSSPTALFGEGWQSILKAKTGFTGTILQAWSIAGISIHDFSIDANSTATVYFDMQWKPGTGPSTQNNVYNIRGYNAPAAAAGPLMNFDNCNDTTFYKIASTAASQSTIAMSFNASGGLTWLDSCIWNGGYLRFGCQNGQIQNSWGHGIQFASGNLNYVNLNSCYIYANSNSGYLLWSQSFSSAQSIRALKCVATQFITQTVTATAYFNLNAYSTLDFDGCQFIGNTTTMWGASCRSDSYTYVRTRFRGGSTTTTTVSLTEPTTLWVTEADGFMNDVTGYNYNKNWGGTFTATVGGTTSGTVTQSSFAGNYYRIGNRVFYDIRVTWSAVGSAVGNLKISGFPFTQVSGNGNGATIAYANNPFSGAVVYPLMSSTSLLFYTPAGAAVAVPSAGDLVISGDYEVTA